MPTTRAKATAEPRQEEITEPQVGTKRQSPPPPKTGGNENEPPAKRPRGKKPSSKGTKSKKAQKTEAVAPPPEEPRKEHGILESGQIYFIHLPKAEVEGTGDIDTVSKFHFLLVPRSDVESKVSPDAPAAPDTPAAPAPAAQDEPKKRFRNIKVGKKHLPDVEARHEAFWASVVNQGEDLDALEYVLEERVHETQLRAERDIQPARLAGRGLYAIFSPMDERGRSYLAYHLTHPSALGEMQTELGLQPSSALLLQVKNPDVPAAPQTELAPESYAAEGVHETIEAGVARFVAANPTTLLDDIGAELLFTGETKEASAVTGEARPEDLEEAANREADRLSMEEVLRGLLADMATLPANLLEGRWI